MAAFILVHGTFAKSAHWPNLQDSLAETTRAAGDEPLFEQLAWTGKNRARARQAAASAIFTLVQRIQRTWANEKIFIIGHSHGGSAIAYFLKEHPEAAKTLAGCAFLSTPFVAIRPRREAVRLLLMALLLFPCIVFVTVWGNFWSLGYQVPWDKPIATVFMYDLAHRPAYYFGLGIAAAIVWLVQFFFTRAGAPQKLEQSIRQQTADIPAGNYLFLRCSGDEAAAALSAAQFIAWLGIKVSPMLELLTRPLLNPWRLFNPGRRVAQGVLWLVVGLILYTTIANGWLVVFPGILKSGFGYFLSPREDLIFIVYDLVSFVMVCLFFLYLLGVFLIFLTQAVTSWVFGWTRLSTGFLVELAIEPLPFGEHSLIHIDWAAGSVGLDGIVHSWTYAHPVAIMHLQNWVMESLGKLPVTAAEPTTIRP
jgi:pimeloyl-ACP methyl ester carboxylesterase